jgi:hypothetical protein
MNKFGLPILLLLLSGCVNHPPNAAHVFSNAQIQYQSKDSNTIARKRDTEMPSYYFTINYEPNQIVLNKKQEQKIATVFKKLIYPEEYKLYVSFGAGGDDNISPALKRAQYIKTTYAGKLKAVQIAYFKNQTPNSAYFRLIT